MTPVPHPIHDVLAAKVAAPARGVVVDLGCGPGHTLAALRRRRPGTRLIGIDLTPGALAAARQTTLAAGLVQADLSCWLPLRDASVDALVCHNVIELRPDPFGLFVEARRVLRANGRAVWSHTDFASLVIHGADQDLTARICWSYAEIPQRWMAHVDPRAGRGIPALARRAGLTVEGFDAQVLTATRLTGRARRRVDELTGVVCRHITQERVELTLAQVQTWRTQLDHADAAGEFCFAETAFITSTSRPR